MSISFFKKLSLIDLFSFNRKNSQNLIKFWENRKLVKLLISFICEILPGWSLNERNKWNEQRWMKRIHVAHKYSFEYYIKCLMEGMEQMVNFNCRQMGFVAQKNE